MVFETEKEAVYGKQFAKMPQCPFCGLPVERPTELETRRYGDMPVGSCACGAVYACDAAGRNLGSAFIEALVFGCDMDWDLAWSLLPEEDYNENLVENYDYENHLVVPGGFYGGRRISGALYFVRLHRDIREAVGQGVSKKLDRARTAARPAGSPSGPAPKALSRKEIEDLVNSRRADPLIRAGGENKKILRELQRLLYSGDELIRNRAAEMLGLTAAAAARKDPGAVSTLLQGLLNSVAAPGAASWGAIEAIGEIVANSPDLYAGYIPPLYTFLGDPDHRPRILRAVARVAEARPDLVRGAAFRLMPFLGDQDPGTRGHAAQLFGSLGMGEAVQGLEKIKNDPAEVKVYKNGNLEKKTVGRLAGEALEKLRAGSRGQETGDRRQETEC